MLTVHGSKERNREAAAKSRLKKHNKMSGLEQQVNELRDGMADLTATNASMQIENSSLKVATACAASAYKWLQAQVSALSELLFRIGSSVKSEDVKKVLQQLVKLLKWLNLSLCCRSG